VGVSYFWRVSVLAMCNSCVSCYFLRLLIRYLPGICIIFRAVSTHQVHRIYQCLPPLAERRISWYLAPSFGSTTVYVPAEARPVCSAGGGGRLEQRQCGDKLILPSLIQVMPHIFFFEIYCHTFSGIDFCYNYLFLLKPLFFFCLI
jgi:hypothetical protein